MNKHYISIFVLIFILIIAGCKKNTPKPIGYYRIEIPKNEYQRFESKDYPYQFDMSKYAKVIPRKDEGDDKYWIDIYYPRFNGKIYCSYKKINNNLQEISEDTREFVYKHTIKADEITEQPFINEAFNTHGILYKLEGNTASTIQFVLTDSTNYFFRGALYFNCPPNKDSIAPVVNFIHKDIIQLMESFRHNK